MKIIYLSCVLLIAGCATDITKLEVNTTLRNKILDHYYLKSNSKSYGYSDLGLCNGKNQIIDSGEKTYLGHKLNNEVIVDCDGTAYSLVDVGAKTKAHAYTVDDYMLLSLKEISSCYKLKKDLDCFHNEKYLPELFVREDTPKKFVSLDKNESALFWIIKKNDGQLLIDESSKYFQLNFPYQFKQTLQTSLSEINSEVNLKQNQQEKDYNIKRNNIISGLKLKNEGEIFISTSENGCRFFYEDDGLKWRLKRLNELAKKNGEKKEYSESQVKEETSIWMMAEGQQALNGAFLSNKIIVGNIQPKAKSPHYYTLFASNGAFTILHFPNDQKIPCGDVLILTQAVSTDSSGFKNMDRAIVLPLNVDPNHAITEKTLEELIKESK